MSGEWGRSGENMGLGQIEEKLNEGLSHGWKGEKCSGGWGQTRKNGEAELPGQDWEEDGVTQLRDLQSRGYPRVVSQPRET